MTCLPDSNADASCVCSLSYHTVARGMVAWSAGSFAGDTAVDTMCGDTVGGAAMLEKLSVKKHSKLRSMIC